MRVTVKKKYTSAIFLLCLLSVLTGFVIAVTFKSLATESNNATSPTNRKYRDLIEYIGRLETETAEMENMMLAVRTDMAKLQKEQSAGSQAMMSLQQALDEINFRAKFTEVSGPGIIITIDDNVSGAETAQKNNPVQYFPENYIVHDRNLLYIIKALAGGSESISVNNIRLGDNYHIRCVGTVIMVNSVRLAPPYEIKIIGDPDKLEEALLKCNEYIYLKSIEMPVKYTKSSQLLLPAYTGSYVITDIKEAERNIE